MASSGETYLGDFYLKRERAQIHFEALRNSVQSANSLADTRMGEYDREANQYVFRLPVREIDSGWNVMLGDLAYNARAALDYLITALVRRAGGKDGHRSEFPIFGGDVFGGGSESWSTIDAWWDQDPSGQVQRKLANTPEGTKEALKQLQPFYGVPQTNPVLHPLNQLKILSNRDKHRRLNLLVHVASIDFVDQSGKPLYPGGGHRVKVPEPDAGGDYTVYLSKDQETSTKVFLVTKTSVHLDERPELVGDLLDTVLGILEFLDHKVVPTVKRLL